MNRKRNGGMLLASLFCTLACLSVAPGPARAEFTEHFRLRGDRLLLVNLIGAIQVLPAPGDDFEIEVAVRGQDADRDRIDFEQDSGGSALLWIRFPLDEERDYRYPEMGSGNSSFDPPRPPGQEKSGRWRLRNRHTVHVRGEGRGIELWADVTVRVPAGKELRIRHGAGRIEAAEVTGDLDAELRVGDIMLEQVRGDVTVDTGSGDVRAANVGGSLAIDTGSGSVRVEDAGLERLSVDTGSGDVEVRRVASPGFTIDTGSGSVTVDLARLGQGEYVVDTGSGSINLRLPPDGSAEVRADTGSGGITVKVADARFIHRSDDQVSLEIGSGGPRIDLDTGSGSILIER